MGEHVGFRRIETLTSTSGPAPSYSMRCGECGALEVLTVSAALTSPCYSIGEDCMPCLAGVSGDDDELVIARLAACPRLDPDTRYDDDPDAMAWCAEHPDGATLSELGAMFGLSRERVRQIEAGAIEVVRRVLLDAGYGAEDLDGLLR